MLTKLLNILFLGFDKAFTLLVTHFAKKQVQVSK